MLGLSIVIPLFNEKENVEILYNELKEVLGSLSVSYEIIFVDDGSIDQTFNLLTEIHKQDPRVKVVRLGRNFGQTAALSAGFDHAKGELVITLDGDLQNDPKDIPRLLEEMEKGYDVVSGWRKNRKDPFFTKRLPSFLANKLISAITGVSLHDYGCTLKAYRRKILKDINLYGELHRFIPALAHWVGASIKEIEVGHRSRKYGKSKYRLSRTIKVILDLITVKFLLSYSTRPLQIFGLAGIISGVLGFGLAVLIVIQRQIFRISADRPLLLLAILLILTSFQFISIGLLGELQARTYHESQNKPIYVVKEILGERGEEGREGKKGETTPCE